MTVLNLNQFLDLREPSFHEEFRSFTKLLSLDAKNNTAFAISSCLPTRPIGTRLASQRPRSNRTASCSLAQPCLIDGARQI